MMRGLASGAAVAVLSIAPAWAGPPFVTDDPEPVDFRHSEFFVFSMGTLAAANQTTGMAPGFEYNYGVIPSGRIGVVAPIAFGQSSAGSFNLGYGDTELSFKYKFVEQDKSGWRPDIAVAPQVNLPTGDPRRGLGEGNTRTFLPLWAQKDFGDWTTYGGGGFWVNPGAANRNFWFAGWVLQRKVTDKLSIGGELFRQTAEKIGDRPTSGFNVGAIYDADEHHHLLFSIGRGIENAKATNQLSWYIGLQVTD